MTDSDSRHGILPPAKPQQSRPAAPRGMKPGLTALGTAAVLGIYAAGFALTQEAAHGLDGARRDSPRPTAQLEGSEEGQGAVDGGTGIAASGGTGLDDQGGAGSGTAEDGRGSNMAGGPAGSAAGGPAGGSLDRSAGAAKLGTGPQGSLATSAGAATRPASPVSGNPSAGTVAGSRGTTASTSSGTRTAGTAPGGSTPPANAGNPPNPGSSVSSSQGAQTPSPGSGSATASATSQSPSAPAQPPESPFLDGKYTAWGIRTGHGDIEATVEISGGRIVSAVVSNCMMRWPCTDVDPLIGRIIRSQRPHVPVITGATQSSDAFTTAVNEALTLARAAKTAQAPTP